MTEIDVDALQTAWGLGRLLDREFAALIAAARERDVLKAELDEARQWRDTYQKDALLTADRLHSANAALATHQHTHAVLMAAAKVAGEALGPFAEFAPRVEQFVSERAKSANDIGAIMPTRHFRLAHFENAKASYEALALLTTALGGEL